MSFIHSIRYAWAIAALFVFVGSASAQSDLGPRQGSPTSSSQLNLSAIIQNAIQLDIETASGGAAVIGGTRSSSTGVFSVDFGNLNGLGLGSAAPGVSPSAQSNGILYSTPVKLTPYFTGFTGTNASISVYVDPLDSNAAGLAAARLSPARANIVADDGRGSGSALPRHSARRLSRYFGDRVSGPRW